MVVVKKGSVDGGWSWKAVIAGVVVMVVTVVKAAPLRRPPAQSVWWVSGCCDGGVMVSRPPVTFFTVQGCEAHPYPDTTETTR